MVAPWQTSILYGSTISPTRGEEEANSVLFGVRQPGIDCFLPLWRDAECEQAAPKRL